MLLAGDVGGTKTLLALLEAPAGTGPPTILREVSLPSREFSTFEGVVVRFLADGAPGRIDAACFGVAGAVVDGRCTATNLPWVLDEQKLAADIPAGRVRLMNDLEATGHGVLALEGASLDTLQPGTRRPGNIAVIAAGTGLGEALLVWDGRRHLVVASEGGHADFAPRTGLEDDLLKSLRGKHGHVSYERVLSGRGLFNIYRFLRETSGLGEPPWLRARLAEGDPGAVVSQAALDGADPVCSQALDVFVGIYGAEAGNLALKGLTVGGVFVGGGIGPKIRRRLAAGAFVEAFRDKGRFANLLAAIPVHLVLEPRTALLGAVRVAHALSRE
ncbi:MAG: glucokinase [Candidatus Rokuibacteriota bacterium]